MYPVNAIPTHPHHVVLGTNTERRRRQMKRNKKKALAMRTLTCPEEVQWEGHSLQADTCWRVAARRTAAAGRSSHHWD